MKRDAWGRPLSHNAVGAFVDRFVWVETYLKATPTTLPYRLERLTKGLQSKGWTVLVRSVATDFEFVGVPVPKVQKVTLGLYKSVHTRRQALGAVQAVAKQLNEGFSPLQEYVRELERGIVRPTLEQVKPVMGLSLGIATAILLGLLFTQRFEASVPTS